MKTTCPNCNASYRVEDEKVPRGGAQIKCPKCGTFFVVMRLAPKDAPKPPSPPPVEMPPPQPQPQPKVASYRRDADGLQAEPKQPTHSDHVGSRARGISAIRAQSGIAPPPPVPAAEAATDEQPVQSEPLQTSDAHVDATSRPRKKAGLLLWGAVIATYLLLLVGAIITLTRYGIWDLSPYLPLREIGIEPPAQVAEQETANGSELAKPDPEAVFGKAVSEGASALQRKNFSKAVLEYNRALSVHPDSREALDGLAKAFEGLGDRERALHTLNMAKSN
jgi:predicted Zn finger-like uncharacterized protein